MSVKRCALFQRFLALLVILSVTLTQALPPAFALRPEMDKTGLEEAFHGAPLLQIASPAGDVETDLLFPPEGDWDSHLASFPAKAAAPPRAIPQRITALEKRFEKFSPLSKGERLPDRLTDLFSRLTQAVDDEVLTLEEASDPLLSLALLVPSQRKLHRRAEQTIAEWEKLCPNCGERALLETPAVPTVLGTVEEQTLGLLTAVATASDLYLLGGELRKVAVDDVDHGQQVARTLQTMGWMRGLMLGAEDGQISAGETPLTEEGLNALAAVTDLGKTVVALVSHPRTPGDRLDHYVRIVRVDAASRTVLYVDNGAGKSMPYGKFIQLHAAAGGMVLLLPGRQMQLFKERGGRWQVVQGERLKELCGACGIITHTGRYAEEGGLAAAYDAAYRGQDNTGEVVVDHNGVRKVAAQGSPAALIREFQIHGQGNPEEAMMLYLEANPSEPVDPALRKALELFREGRPLDERQRFLIHAKWRNLDRREAISIQLLRDKKAKELLAAQGLGWVNPQELRVVDPSTKAARPAVKDDFYRIGFYAAEDPAVSAEKNKKAGEVRMDVVVGIGKQGHLWSGRWFSHPRISPPGEGEAAAHHRWLQDLGKRILSAYQYDLNALRDILRSELESTVGELREGGKLDASKAGVLLDDFGKLFDLAWARPLKPEELKRWKDVWEVLTLKPIRVAGHVASGPVRHAFRLQGRLISAIRKNSSDFNEVSRIFKENLPDQNRDWFQDWLVESATNTPGKAFQAITRWFQTNAAFIDQGLIDRYGIELGQMDSLTLAHLPTVDRIVRHDRWATTGSRRPKDAQPLTDTGFLSGMDDKALKKVTEIAQVRADREIWKENRRRESRQPGSAEISSDEKSEILRRQFTMVTEDFLQANPHLRGSPMRAYVHNGDLSPTAQQGMMRHLQDNGYYNQQTRVGVADGTPVTEPILTDTWKIVGTHEFIYDQFRKDRLLGLVDQDNRYKDASVVGFMPEAYRVLWNDIVRTFKHRQRAVSPDEVARRIAAIEFARGVLTADRTKKIDSEMALSWVSQYDLGAEGMISHRRPASIVVVRDKDGNVQIQYTSDPLTALRMFDPQDVVRAIQEDQKLSSDFKKVIDDLVKGKESKAVDDKQFRDQLILAVAKFDLAAERLKKLFQAEMVINLSGSQKYVNTRRVWNSDMRRFDVTFEITDFQGKLLATLHSDRGRKPEIVSEELDNIKIQLDKPVEVDVASKAGYRTFGQKEIASQLAALVKMWVGAGLDPKDPLSPDITKEGLEKSDQVKQKALGGAGIQDKLPESKGGLFLAVIQEFVRQVLKKGEGTILSTGVGSSENDSTAADAFFRFLLPMCDYDPTTPARLLSMAAHYDPDTTLANGITWSGTTALTTLALAWLKSQGVKVAGITGNPAAADIQLVNDGAAGTVWARTKKEIAVYTTVGFLMLMEGLFEEALELNKRFAEKTPDENSRQELHRRREVIYPDYTDRLRHLSTILDDPHRNIDQEGSQVNRAAFFFKAVTGFRMIGDYPNNPILDELGIKVGEVANVTFTSYGVRSPRYRTAVAEDPELNVGDFLNATSASRMKEFREYLRWCRENKRSAIVQTFGKDADFAEEGEGPRKEFEEFLKELDDLEKDFDGADGRPLVVRFEVPKVHPALQPFLDVVTGQLFAVALAFAKGLTPDEVDGPRNLAKSVTVLGVTMVAAASMMAQEFAMGKDQSPEALKKQLERYLKELEARWSQISSPSDQGIHRLPVRMAEGVNRLQAGGAQLEQGNLQASFGESLEGLRRIVIVYDSDDAAEAAGRMSSIPLAYREMVVTNSPEEKIFARVHGREGGFEPVEITRAVNGRPAVFRFERSPSDNSQENKLSITFIGEEKPALVLYTDEKEKIHRSGSAKEQTATDWEPSGRTVTLAGKKYRVEHFGKRGIGIVALNPDLLGVKTQVRHVSYRYLEQDVRPGTLVIALSRSNQRGEKESKVVPIASALTGRDAEQKGQVSAAGENEGQLQERLQQLKDKRVPIITIGDDQSAIHGLGTHGFVRMDAGDLDVHTSTLAYFVSLMMVGARLGGMKEIGNAAYYESSLEAVPALLARTLAHLYREEVELGQRLFEGEVLQVTVPLAGRPYRFRYAQEGDRFSATAGTVRLYPGTDDEQTPAAEIGVRVSNGRVVGLAAPDAVLTLEGRSYRVKFDEKARGLYLEAVEPDYAGGGSLRRALVSLRQNRFGPKENPGRQMKTWGVVGGVQDRGSAAAIALALEQAGFQARHLEVDESVHGFYALIHDAIEKFSQWMDRLGVSPDYDPDDRRVTHLRSKDVGLIILATDSRTFGASIMDAQRAVTRNARVILVVRESDRNRPEVVNAGAYHIITVPDTFNDLTSVGNELVGRVLARELARSLQKEFSYEEGSPWAQLALLPAVERKARETKRQGASAWVIGNLEEFLLDRGRDDQTVDWFAEQFVDVQEKADATVPAVQMGTDPANGDYLVTTSLVYGTRPDLAAPREVLEERLLAATSGILADGAKPKDIFVTDFPKADGESLPGVKPVLMVQFRFKKEHAAVAEVARQRMREIVSPYLPGAPAVPPSAPPSDLEKEVLKALGRNEAFLPFSGEFTRLLEAFEREKKPQCSQPLQNKKYPDSVLVLTVGENRPGMLADVSRIFGNARINIADYFSPNVPGFEGAICLRLTTDKKEAFSGFAGRVASLREKILEALVVPAAVSLPGLPPPTAGQRLDPVAYPVSGVLTEFGAGLVHSGMIGAGGVPGVDVKGLEGYAKSWAGDSLKMVAEGTPGLAFVSGVGRIGHYRIVTDGERHDALVNAVDNVAPALVPAVPGAEPRECALPYAVFGPGLRNIGDPEKIPYDFYAQILAFWVPPGEEGKQLKEFASQDPLMPVGQVAGFLDKIARAHGEHPPLVEVWNLLGRDRERLFAAEFQRLAQEGLIRNARPKNGTVEMALRSNIPASSRPAPGEVVVAWTTGLLPQAMASLYLSAAMPEGAMVFVRVLPDDSILNSKSYQDQATESNPIGGADAFSPSHKAQLEAWLGPERAKKVLRGEWLSTLDIKDPVYGVLVPLTPTSALPFPVAGITAVEGAEIPGHQQYRVPVIRVQDGNVWLQEEEVVPPLAADQGFKIPPPFLSVPPPGAVLPTPVPLPEAEQRRFADQIRVSLGSLGFQGPQAEAVVEQVMPAFQRFQETDLPQVVAVAHPSGQKDRSILAVVDRFSDALPDNIHASILGAGVRLRRSFFDPLDAGDSKMSVGIIEVANKGAQDLGPAQEDIKRNLIVSHLMEDFEEKLQEFGLSPLEINALFDIYRMAPNFNGASLRFSPGGVPAPEGKGSPGTFVAFALTTHSPKLDVFKETFEKTLRGEGIPFEQVLSITYEPGVYQNVKQLRVEPYRLVVYRVQAPGLIVGLLDRAMADFPGYGGGPLPMAKAVPEAPLQPTPEPLLELLRENQTLIAQMLEAFRSEKVIQFTPVPGPVEGETTILAVGGEGVSGALDDLIYPLKEAHELIVSPSVLRPLDAAGLAVIVVQDTLEQLEGKGVFSAIQEAGFRRFTPQAGLEEAGAGLSDLRQEMNLLPSAASLTPGIGVIAGSRGLAYGVALSRLSASDGSPLPVVFVVESGLEEDFLKELGFTDG
ncbi:MAG: hypothetical protein HYS41_04400, partial [Candidatus Omnitrophica bacterium]|nr:hypothetical protein [Candidatus Omnitrophota bacterium]